MQQEVDGAFFRNHLNLIFSCPFKSPGNTHLQPKAAGAGAAT